MSEQQEPNENQNAAEPATVETAAAPQAKAPMPPGVALAFVIIALLGVLIFSVIQTGILFDGRLNSSWMRIVVGLLLLAFILLQRLLLARRKST